jgi:hypothetical protein
VANSEKLKMGKFGLARRVCGLHISERQWNGAATTSKERKTDKRIFNIGEVSSLTSVTGAR